MTSRRKRGACRTLAARPVLLPLNSHLSREALASLAGPLAIGSPGEVAEKIVSFHELFRPERYIAHISIGAVFHAEVMRAVELFGTEVAPIVQSDAAPGPGRR